MPGRQPTSERDVSVLFSETMAGAAVLDRGADLNGVLAGGALSMNIRVRLPSLVKFESRNTVYGRILAGSVAWDGHLEPTPLERNSEIRIVRDGRIAGISRVAFRVRALEPDGGRTTFHVARVLDPLGKPYDSEIKIRRRGELVGRGVMFDPPRGYDQHISDVQVSGATPVARRRGLARFLELIRSAPRPIRRDTDEVAVMVRTLVGFLHDQHPGGPTAEDIEEQYLEMLRRVPAWRRASIERFLEGNIGALRFFREATRLLIRNPVARVVNTTSLDAAHNLYQFLYYTLQKSYTEIGHEPMPLGEPDRPPTHATLETSSLKDLGSVRDEDGWTLKTEFDVVVIGSGPAGSLLAHRLGADRRVLVLDKGKAVPEGLHRGTDNAEFEAYTELYEGAGLQAANDDWGELNKEHGSVFILQGACVGGGGLVNNSIFVRMSDERIRRWMKAGFPLESMPRLVRARHPEDQLHAAYDIVGEELGLRPLDEALARGAPRNPIADRLGSWDPNPREQPSATARRGTGGGFTPLLLATEGCVGCGFCNVGCAYGVKRSSYDVYLKGAVEDPERSVTVAAESEVVEIKLTPDGAAVDHLVVDMPHTEHRQTGTRRVRVRAKEYILSAGAVGSSLLLLKSPDIRRLRGSSAIGTRFSANLAVPLVAVYDEPMQDRRGLQMTHAFVPERGEDEDGYAIETWSSEPGGFALGIPGYFASHRRSMRTYGRASAAVVLVGSHPSLGSVHWYDPRAPRAHRTFDKRLDDYGIRPDPRRGVHLDPRPYILLEMRQTDDSGNLTRHARRLRDSFRNGLRRLALQMIEGGEGRLKHVLVPSRHGWRLRTKEDVDLILGVEADLEDERPLAWKGELRDIRSLRITSAHPQGGNPLLRRGGVVGPDFRMRGVGNLRVCDASVFPDNVGVNPQWTVLALAHFCSEQMRREPDQGG